MPIPLNRTTTLQVALMLVASESGYLHLSSEYLHVFQRLRARNFHDRKRD